MSAQRDVYYGNEPTTAPDFDGAGRAWAIPNTSDVPDHQASVGQWLVHAPFGHPFWWWYCISCIHLRPIPGVPPAHIRFPGASHELIFVALSPEKPLPDLADWKDMTPLTPFDLEHQFIVPNDDDARELGELVVRHIVDGHPPDQDYRAYWCSAINRTAEHLRLGGHPGEGS